MLLLLLKLLLNNKQEIKRKEDVSHMCGYILFSFYYTLLIACMMDKLFDFLQFRFDFL